MIALIASPAKEKRFQQGLGPFYIAAVLESEGYEVKIFDKYDDVEESEERLDHRLALRIAQEEPSIVGVTLTTPFYRKGTRLAKYLREMIPNVLLVAGGHHATAEPVELLKNSQFDIVVVGEGETTMKEIVSTPEDLGRIKGIVYKEDGKIHVNPPRPLIQNLDNIPYPARHLASLNDYSSDMFTGVRSTSILTTRGCPYECVYCMKTLGNELRSRSAQNVVNEIEHVIKEHGVRGFQFWDDMFGLNRDLAAQICELVTKKKINIVWWCWANQASVDRELLQKMHDAGCRAIAFGVESVDDEVLKKAKRPLFTEQSRRAIKIAKEIGIKVHTYFTVGLPGETEQSIQKSIEFIKETKPDRANFSLLCPYPGTELWNRPAELGVKITRLDNWEAYIETEVLSHEDLRNWVRKANKEVGGESLTSINSNEYVS